MRTPITVGVAGLSPRGLQLARAFDDLPDADVRWVCDPSAEVRHRIRSRFSKAQVVADFEDLCADEELDAVVIASPASTRYELARRALDADKHVLMERPIAVRGEDAEDLLRTARRRRRRLMLTNDLVLHPGVRMLKESIEHGALGELLYMHGNRYDPGALYDAPVIWSLGADHVSTILFLLGDEPFEVTAQGEKYLQAESEDVVFCSLKFATGISAYFHLSRLDPQSLSSLATVGSKRMALLEGIAPAGRLMMYERESALRPSSVPDVEAHIGDIVIPSLPNEDALPKDCERVIALVRSYADPEADVREAIAVVYVLEALERSLEEGGAPERVGANNRPTGTVISLLSSFQR